jgi:hypothetical protein
MLQFPSSTVCLGLGLVAKGRLDMVGLPACKTLCQPLVNPPTVVGGIWCCLFVVYCMSGTNPARTWLLWRGSVSGYNTGTTISHELIEEGGKAPVQAPDRQHQYSNHLVMVPSLWGSPPPSPCSHSVAIEALELGQVAMWCLAASPVCNSCWQTPEPSLTAQADRAAPD